MILLKHTYCTCGCHSYIDYLCVGEKEEVHVGNEKLTQQGVSESGMTVTIIVTSHVD